MCFSLRRHQICRHGFLQTNCDVKSESVWKRFPCSAPLKPWGLSSTSNGPFTPTWFHDTMQWSFGKYGLTALWKPSKYWHISIQIDVSNISTDLIMTAPKCWKAIRFTISAANLPSSPRSAPVSPPRFLPPRGPHPPRRTAWWVNSGWMQGFPKSPFCSKAWILALAINTLSYCSWNDRRSWLLFLKMPARDPRWNLLNLCVSHFFK